MKSLIPLLLIGMALWFGLNFLDQSTSVGGSSGGASGSPVFVKSYETALRKAQAENKPMVLVFSASWCPPCKTMQKEVYPSREVMPYRSEFVWAYLDVDNPGSQSAARKHGVQGIPHIQFLDAKGKDIGKVVGSQPPRQFAEELRQALATAS